MSTDTFSGAVFVLAHAGESTKETIRHFLLLFATLGVPKDIKTDNGPAYTSHKLKDFFNQWGVKHNMGIPHSPIGQAVIERAHSTLKWVLNQQQGGTGTTSAIKRLCKALYAINFLNSLSSITFQTCPKEN